MSHNTSCISHNNCCDFIAFYGVIFQNVIKLFLKTPVFGAPLSNFNLVESVKIFMNECVSCLEKHSLPSFTKLILMTVQQLINLLKEALTFNLKSMSEKPFNGELILEALTVYLNVIHQTSVCEGFVTWDECFNPQIIKIK